MKLSNGRRLRGATALAVVAFGLSAFTTSVAMTADGPVTFNIPAENTAQALDDFAKQAGVQILFPYDVAERFSSPVLKGEFTRQEALARLLADSGLEIATQTDSTISLRVKERREQSISEAPTEVIVTGTHIRGGNPTSPVRTLTQKDIEASGYSQIGDLLRSLPENFSGGQNPGVIGATGGNAGNGNLTGASSLNLRGLGSDATLLLVNGHRLSNDGQSEAADISGVPLGAVQRIEIVPDGASALYGSDAVAGVVNVILRKDFNGVELSAVGGAASQGAGTNRQASILAGAHGSNWYGLMNLEVQNQDAVLASDRARTASVAPDTTLLPGLKRRSLFVTGGRDLTDAITVSGELLFNERVMRQTLQLSPTSAEQQYHDTTPAFTASVNLDARLGGDWRLHVNGLSSGGRTSFDIDYPSLSYRSHGLYRNTLQAVEFTTDGALFHLPSGPVKGAFGAGVRRETFNSPSAVSQTVDYAFGELRVPLVDPSAVRAGLHELEIDASARTEQYSTFGRTTDPKIGIRYVPLDGLTLRANWGKSFKAPSFLQMYSTSYAYLVDSSTIGYKSPGVVLATLGGNPNLKPETSTSWTFGGEYTPPSAKGLTVSATWFSIDYRHRVVQPASVIVGALSTTRYAPFVEASPSAATQAQVFASADTFLNLSSGAYDPSNVVALFRDALVNASAQTEQGVDLGYRQAFSVGDSTISTFANVTALRLRQQYIPTSPVLTLSGTVNNVPRLKSRAGVTFDRQGFSASLIDNFVSSETDNGVAPDRQVGSWNTADVTVFYAFRSGNLSGLKIGAAVQNLFDRKPPVTYSSAIVYGGLNYDSTNASILGRYTSFSISKAW